MGIALLGVQVGPWLWQEFVEGDAEHLGHGHDGLQRGVGGGCPCLSCPIPFVGIGISTGLRHRPRALG